MTDHERQLLQDHLNYTNQVLGQKLRSDLTDEQKLEAARIGRIQFASAGATRKQ